MKAQTLTEIKTALQFQERPELVPQSDEVVVRLKASSLNRRDFWITQGMYPGIQLPIVLGSDGAGVVTQCGSAVTSSWQDRDVIINPGMSWGENPKSQSDDFHILGLPRDGTFATEVAVPADQLFAKPEHLSWEQAAAIPLAGVTAFRALMTQGQLQKGQNVLIAGIGGGVATFVLQFALALEANVWVTSSSQQKVATAVELGAKGGVLYTEKDWDKSLSKLAGQIDLVIDSAGGDNYRSLVNLAAPGATIVNYGATTGPPEKLDMFKVFWKQLTLRGSTMGSPDDFKSMLDLVDQHQIQPVIDQVFSLADANEALAVMKSSSQFGKLVLTNP
jgi:NADPH:quinone reductase-like Zn-dependent oxidoreductase